MDQVGISSMKKNDEWEGSRGERAVLERVVKEGLSKEITFKQRPE